jgi:sortase A
MTEPSFTPRPVADRPVRVAALLAATLRRRGGQRALSVVVAALLVAGGGLFAYPWLTDIWAHLRQHDLNGAFTSRTRQSYLDGQFQVGEGLTELAIPSLHVHVLVVQGTTAAALEAGAGHYLSTPLPGQRGNVGIAGHRTTFGRPFNQLNLMRPGQTVTLTTPFYRYTYVVVPTVAGHPNPWVVLPDASWVVGQAGPLGTGHWLTLTTCNPKGSDTQRLIVRLRLVASVALPAARRLPGHRRPGGGGPVPSPTHRPGWRAPGTPTELAPASG